MMGPFDALTNRLDWLRREVEPYLWSGSGAESSFVPPLNVWEDGDKAYVELEVPGLKIDDFSVSVQDGVLSIQGEKKIEARETSTVHRRERVAGPFARSLKLPWEVAADKVEAALKDGVLTISLPKAEAAKPRKVDVKYADGK